MSYARLKRLLLCASLAAAALFAACWLRTYWFDMFLGYDTRTTTANGGHKFWVATDSGAFDIAIQWESFNPNQRRDRGAWRFYDTRRKPGLCAFRGEPEPSLLGFRHWVVGTPDSYHYNYTWIPFWLPTLLFALPVLWYFLSTKLTPDGPANRSQPIRSGTNRASSAAGSRVSVH
jgi:hypothetical protein